MTAAERVNRRHLAGFRRLQTEMLRALKAGVPPKEYRALAAAYKEAVSGERMVLGLGGASSCDWPEEVVVKWVDDDAQDNGEDAV